MDGDAGLGGERLGHPFLALSLQVDGVFWVPSAQIKELDKECLLLTPWFPGLPRTPALKDFSATLVCRSQVSVPYLVQLWKLHPCLEPPGRAQVQWGVAGV